MKKTLNTIPSNKTENMYERQTVYVYVSTFWKRRKGEIA
jgi:hypothetical protein